MPARGLFAGLAGTVVMAALFESFGWAARSEPPEAPKAGHPLFWTYGTAWGAAFGRGPLTTGPRFGAGVWMTSLTIQAALRIGDAPWRRPPSMLAADGTTHLLYGLTVAGAARATAGRPTRRARRRWAARPPS